MLKLSAIALLTSSLLSASTSDTQIVQFLQNSFKNNPNIISIDIKVVDTVEVPSVKGWEAFIVNLDAVVKAEPTNREVKQKMVWFSNGEVVTQDLIDLKSGTSLKDSISPSFKAEFYKKENLIYGNANATHKMAIFSDPLCPFCRDYVPKAIEFMKKDPKKYAVYYYHFPLPSIHPAAVTLTKAAVAAELQGRKDVVLDLYKVDVNARESDAQKILDAFNLTMKTKITLADIAKPEVVKQTESDLHIADQVMVQGTPTVFFDSKIDKSKRMYERVK
jgi:protein-disulfide isomerase